MALVNVVNMVVLDNPTCFLNPFQFEITFECLQELQDDLEWKVLYVGSAHDSHQDQVLDEILVGPVPVGLNKFVLQADAPDPAKLPPDEVLGVTVVLVVCCYQEKEFVRVGFYVNNEYLDPEYATPTPTTIQQPADPNNPTVESSLEPPPPPKPLPSYPNLNMKLVQRHILADKPRVTKFPISWGTKEEQEQAAAALAKQQQGTSSNKFLGQQQENDMATTPSTTASSTTAAMNTSMDMTMMMMMEE